MVMPTPSFARSTTLVTREITVLRTLALVGWLTTEQLHVLCFPGDAMATVRLTLRYLEGAGWLRHARWRIKATSGSNVWCLGHKGPLILNRYGDGTPPRVVDLARPSTAIEHEEWFVRLQVRLLLVRLILEARQTVLLNDVNVTLSDVEPSTHGFASDAILPDVMFTAFWTPQVMHAFDWLPWLHVNNVRCDTEPTRYALYFDRTAHLANPVYARSPYKRLHAATSDHAIIVVPCAADVERVQQCIPHSNPRVVVAAWPDVTQHVGRFLCQLRGTGQQALM